MDVPSVKAPLLRKRGISQILVESTSLSNRKSLLFIYFHFINFVSLAASRKRTVRKSLAGPGGSKARSHKGREHTSDFVSKEAFFVVYFEPHFWINWSNNELETFQEAPRIIRLEVTDIFFWRSQAPSFDTR